MRRADRARRIIPARAGFTTRPGPMRSPHWDHPRSREVYLKPRAIASATVGSSPLARGLHWTVTSPGGYQRIIPARAGFTPTCRTRPCGTGDHPRSRGVYRRAASRGVQRPGSSPLARGLLLELGSRGVPARIIPARAGFTPIGRTTSRRWRDHPRSRGVYQVHRSGLSVGWGSSPLARGLR